MIRLLATLFLFVSANVFADTFIDRFNSQRYSNNDGTHNWSTNWIENEAFYDDDDAAEEGQIRIIGNRLYLEDGNNSITRTVNLTGYSSATLSFSYEFHTSGRDDDVYIEVRKNNASWNTVFTFEGETSQEGTGNESIDITSYIDDDVDIRIRTASGFDAADDLYLDDFTVTENGGSSSSHTFYDQFNNVSYNNNDGERNFGSAWVERNDYGGASSGDVRVTGGRLQLHGPNKRVRRSVDLSSFRSATMKFDFDTITNNYDDDVYLEVKNASGNWVLLREFDGDGAENGSVSIDLSNYLNSNFQVRFRTSDYFEGGSEWYADYFYIDNFAIDALSSVLACPNTAAYTEIFTDNFSTNKNVYVKNDFTRTVSVWPGESIVNDNQEDQTVDFSISNGRMNIEGSIGANSEGNNEYGAVLHDLSTERYEPENITEYSIEVDMLAPLNSNGYLNNDVGVIFGFQNDNNYYVIKWTKYGDRFANEATYPGSYKNLDLIKVANGVATRLDSVSDFDASYPTRLKITVNADGISICTDGNATLSAPAERPALFKYGYFTYENEEGVAFDNVSIKCNGCQQTLQCPNTSAYSLIFEDKFNTSPNNNWQAHTLDRNTVNVWPNDTIYSNNEERSIMFAVRNGLMDIAGSVSSRSDNEYGVVVHDVVAEGFDDSQINTYSINTKFRSHSSQTNNNDAGVVFGYQNERNFYVLKWTKYAQNYASDTVFPGRHRDLEVIKVVNGQPTQLGVEANFYAADDMDLKITVNADGITICVNGDNLIQIAGERPTLGEIGFFSYDNDYGVSFDDFQVWCQGCSVNNNVDHYRIVHPTAGLTCSNYNVTVAACQNASCSSYSTETVTTQLMKTVGSSTSLVQALNTTTGTQVVNFAHPSAQTVTFSVANLSPAADNALRCVTGSINGASTNCQLVMADSGYVVTVGDFESASGWQTVNVKAMKRDSTSPGSCAPAYQGNKPVKIDFSYISPTIAQGAQADKLYFSKTSNNVGTGTEITSGTPITENIAFDETAQANFYINYKDAGQLELTVSDGATTPALKSGSDRFVVYPTKLTLGLSENGNYLGTKGYEFYTASKPFDLVITAVNKLNEVTANYRPGEFKLLPHMVTPLMSDGANSTTMTYVNASATNQTLTVTNSATSSDWQNVALTFGSAGYNQKASFNNVGSFALDALDDNYFSYDINADAVSAGRIIPYYFTVSTQTQGQLETTGTGYSYIGETLSYAVDPIIKIVAKDFKGTVATNYGGFGDEEGTFHSSPTLSGRTYAETSAGTGFNGGNTTLGTGAFSGHENYDGEFLVTLSDDTFTYAKSATPTPAFTSNIQLTFSEADLTARYLREENPAPADLETNVVGIGYCPEPLDLAVDQCPSEFKSYTMDLVAAPLLRYGRLKLSNTSTSATETDGKVFIPLVVEYWDAANNRYVTNTQDSVTVFNTLNGDITRVSDGAKLNNLLDRSGTKVTNGLPLNGQGLFLPVRDNSNNLLDGEYLLQLNNLPIWLNVDWNGDNKVDNQDMVSSSVIFGSFSGNNRIIYKRER